MRLVTVTDNGANVDLRARGPVQMRIMNPSVKTNALTVVSAPVVSLKSMLVFFMKVLG